MRVQLLVALAASLLSNPAVANSSYNESFSNSADLFSADPVQDFDLPFTRSSSSLMLAQAEGDGDDPAAGLSPEQLEEMRQLGDALANPLSSLWLLFGQNDTTWYDGDLLDRLDEDVKVQNTTYLMPVMPFQLTKEWKIISRVIVPINSWETIDNVDIATDTVPNTIGTDFDRETGLGDIILWTAFSNQYKPPFIWGIGPTIMLDTASEDQLGTGRNSVGPMALVGNITDEWIVLGIFQHWWSIDDDPEISIDTNLGRARVERADVNLTDIQYIVRYRLSATDNIGSAPNIRYNWETDQLSLPVGIGYDTVVKWGKLPIKVGGEVHYFVEQDDDFGPEWMLRLFFSPIVPSPAWSKEPLFGS